MISLMMALVAAATHHVPKLAVLDMVDLSGEQARLAQQLTQVVVTEVAANSDLKVVSSDQIKQLLGFEKQKELLGCQDDSCTAELAGALGVDYVMMEQLGKIGSRFRVDIRIANAVRGNLVGSAGDFVSNNVDDVADAVVKLTQRVLVQAKLGHTSVANLQPNPNTSVGTSPEGVVAPLSTSAPSTPEVSHRSAYASWAISAALVVAAAITTGVDVSTYNRVAAPNDPSHYRQDSAPLAWEAPLADGLWAAAALGAGVGGYLYLTGAPAGAGAGGEVAVGGRL